MASRLAAGHTTLDRVYVGSNPTSPAMISTVKDFRRIFALYYEGKITYRIIGGVFLVKKTERVVETEVSPACTPWPEQDLEQVNHWGKRSIK